MGSAIKPSEFNDLVIVFRSVFAGSITSAGRTIKHNQLVGGVEGSPHIFDLAVDITFDDPVRNNTDIGQMAYAKKLGLLCIIESDHNHLQPLDWVNEDMSLLGQVKREQGS